MIGGFLLLMAPGPFLYFWFEDQVRKEGYTPGAFGARPPLNTIPVPNLPPPPSFPRKDMDRLKAEVEEYKERARKSIENAERETR